MTIAAVPKPAGMGSSQQAVAPAVAAGEEHGFMELSPLGASSLIWEQLSWKVAGCQMTPGLLLDKLLTCFPTRGLSQVIRPQRAPGQAEQGLERGFETQPSRESEARPQHPTPAAAAPTGLEPAYSACP